jgi:MFS family permease
MTILALWLVGRFGRRPLLIGGVAGMVVALVLLGLAFELGSGGEGLAGLAVIALMVYVGAFAISLGPIFWILNAEIYPLKARGHAAGVGTTANWTSNFIVSLTFLPLLNELGEAPTFWLYAAVGIFTIFFCARLVPETKGKQLEEIEAIWQERVSGKASA